MKNIIVKLGIFIFLAPGKSQPMDFRNFIHTLDQKLREPLPGEKAQLKMAPATRVKFPEFLRDGSRSREAAVLILLFPVSNKARIVFIKRATYDGVHSGQISLPGGKKEPSDPSLTETALRETEEEIGICRDKISVLGTLSKLFIPPSNFEVLPVVGFTDAEPEFTPRKEEVDMIITESLDKFYSGELHRVNYVKTRDVQRMNVRCFAVRDHIIWGATAMILSEFLEIIRS